MLLLLRCRQDGLVWKYFKRHNTTRISATELAPALGIGRYRSRNSVYLEKTKRKTARDFENDAMIMGRKMEPRAIASFARVWCTPGFNWLKPGAVLDPVHPVCCSPDAMFWDPTTRELFGLEVKVPFSSGIPDDPDHVSIDHIMQCLMNLHITRAKKWFLYYYDWEKPHKSTAWVIYPNDLLWQNGILTEVRDFMGKVKLSELDSLPRDTNKKGNEIAFRKAIRVEILRETLRSNQNKEVSC